MDNHEPLPPDRFSGLFCLPKKQLKQEIIVKPPSFIDDAFIAAVERKLHRQATIIAPFASYDAVTTAFEASKEGTNLLDGRTRLGTLAPLMPPTAVPEGSPRLSFWLERLAEATGSRILRRSALGLADIANGYRERSRRTEDQSATGLRLLTCYVGSAAMAIGGGLLHGPGAERFISGAKFMGLGIVASTLTCIGVGIEEARRIGRNSRVASESGREVMAIRRAQESPWTRGLGTNPDKIIRNLLVRDDNRAVAEVLRIEADPRLASHALLEAARLGRSEAFSDIVKSGTVTPAGFASALSRAHETGPRDGYQAFSRLAWFHDEQSGALVNKGVRRHPAHVAVSDAWQGLRRPWSQLALRMGLMVVDCSVINGVTAVAGDLIPQAAGSINVAGAAAVITIGCDAVASLRRKGRLQRILKQPERNWNFLASPARSFHETRIGGPR